MAELEDLVLSALAFEAMVDEGGWDQLASLWAMDAKPEAVVDSPAGKVAFAYRRLGEGEPYELIAGADAAGADGLLLALEGWTWPPDATPEERRSAPSTHPDRRELRMVTVAVRGGRQVTVARERGGEPDVVIDEGSGPLVEALLAALDRS